MQSITDHLFEDGQIEEKEKERKKQQPRVAKVKPVADDTSMMDSLF